MADNNSSGMNAVVAIIAIIAILVVGYFAIQMFANGDNGSALPNGTDINVDLGTGNQ